MRREFESSLIEQRAFGEQTTSMIQTAPVIPPTPGPIPGSSPGPSPASTAGRTVSLWLVRRGRITLRVGAQALSMRARQGAFIDATGGVLEADQGSDFVSVTAPLQLLQGESGMGFRGGLLKVTETSVLLDPVLAFVSSLVGSATPGDSGRGAVGEYFVERLLQEMVQGLYIDTVRVQRPDHFSDSFELACALIKAQCTDPGLTARAVADQLGLSLRQLERIFRSRGSGVGQRIRVARVERASRIASDPVYSALRVDEIARYVGFSSGSSLARAMAAEGRQSPSEIRGRAVRAARTTGTLRPNDPDPDIGDTRRDAFRDIGGAA